MAASSQHPLPFPLSLIASALLVLAALILFGLAIMHWRHARRLAADGPRRVVIGWRLVATAYTLWGLAVAGLAGLSLVYPFDAVANSSFLHGTMSAWHWRSLRTPWRCLPLSRWRSALDSVGSHTADCAAPAGQSEPRRQRGRAGEDFTARAGRGRGIPRRRR